MKHSNSERVKELRRIEALSLADSADTILLCETGDLTTKAITDAVKDKKERLICGQVDKPLVTYGGQGIVFNRQYCKENNITILHSPVAVMGGTVIFSAGDLTFNYVTKELRADWIGVVQKGICDYLTGKGLNAVPDKNDILIDGKKISGSSAGIQDGMRIESIFIAVVSSAELIEKICLKKSGKKAASLQEYGISVHEIQEIVIALTKRYMGESEHRQIKTEKSRSKRTLRDVLGSGAKAGTIHNAIRRLQRKGSQTTDISDQ